MHLYSGATTDFVSDAIRSRIALILADAFFEHFRYQAPQSEVRAWQNSLRAMADVVQMAQLDNHGVVVELQLPLSSRRLDCLFTGHDDGDRPQGVIVELKQWEIASPSDIDDCVVVFLGGRERDVLHPSRQVGNYEQYLLDVHTAFNIGGIGLTSCGFAHNLRHDEGAELFSERHRQLLRRWPLFAGDEADDLATFLDGRLRGGDGSSLRRS